MIQRAPFSKVYGSRNMPAAGRTQVMRARLEVLFDELENLFSSAASGQPLPFAFVDAKEPHIAIGPPGGNITAQVSIDAENGLYVFCELDRAGAIVLATASEERLIDQIVAHLGSDGGSLAPHTIDAAVGVLVGQTVEDVERKLILQTLHHCEGNPTYTAFMLGIPLATLCNKLGHYFAESAGGFPVNAKRDQ